MTEPSGLTIHDHDIGAETYADVYIEGHAEAGLTSIGTSTATFKDTSSMYKYSNINIYINV